MVSTPPGTSKAEDERLNGLFDRLRERLLDLSNRNPLLNTRLSSGVRSRRHVQFVDTDLEDVYQRLVGKMATGLDVLPLPEPASMPADEHTREFVTALQHAKATDVEYLTAAALLEKEGRDDELHVADLDEALRLRLRNDRDEGAVHALAHDVGQDRARGADERAGDDQREIAQREADARRSPPRIGIEHRHDDRH
eukprot:gene31006-35311_t